MSAILKLQLDINAQWLSALKVMKQGLPGAGQVVYSVPRLKVKLRFISITPLALGRCAGTTGLTSSQWPKRCFQGFLWCPRRYLRSPLQSGRHSQWMLPDPNKPLVPYHVNFGAWKNSSERQENLWDSSAGKGAAAKPAHLSSIPHGDSHGRKRTNFWRSSFDLHTVSMACGPSPIYTLNKCIETLVKAVMSYFLQRSKPRLNINSTVFKLHVWICLNLNTSFLPVATLSWSCKL